MNCCNNRKCHQVRIINDACCGLCVTSKCSTYCTKVCCSVTYTITVTNNSEQTVKDVFLHVPLDGEFCLNPDTVTVNGQAANVDCLDAIQIGDIASNSTATVVYTCTVMQYKRCIKTRALVTFTTCCCYERRDFGVYSNVNILQVCPCCCCCNNGN